MDLQPLARELFERRYKQKRPGLCRNGAAAFLDQLLPILIPPLGQEKFSSEHELHLRLEDLYEKFCKILACVYSEKTSDGLNEIATAWFAAFHTIEKLLDNDAEFIADSDPAAHSAMEVMLAYPGFYAIAVYRLANALAKLGVPYIPRLFTEIAHSKSGVDIHPMATIDSPFHIDHGTGIVIGETTEIGKRVKIYQGVTLGALAVEKQMQAQKRHPTVEDDAVIYANATILGGNTTIGKGAVIGGSVWITEPVAANARVFHKPTIEVKS